MAFDPNFTVTESISNPASVTISDTSTGSDGTISSRIVYFQLSDGSYIKPTGVTTDFVPWPYAQSSLTITLLDRSEAVNVTVIWLAGSTQKYNKIILWGLNIYDILFSYNKVQTLTSKPKLIDNANFWGSMIKMITNTFCMEVAVELGDDIYSAQEALDRNYDLQQNNDIAFV